MQKIDFESQILALFEHENPIISFEDMNWFLAIIYLILFSPPEISTTHITIGGMDVKWKEELLDRSCNHTTIPLMALPLHTAISHSILGGSLVGSVHYGNTGCGVLKRGVQN